VELKEETLTLAEGKRRGEERRKILRSQIVSDWKVSERTVLGANRKLPINRQVRVYIYSFLG